jgi:hypothetical protein
VIQKIMNSEKAKKAAKKAALLRAQQGYRPMTEEPVEIPYDIRG